jgi:RHH-type proline utilization regulon transcriptional repressor/proline dehydrogenase/delta 1-pyrroline-5-carboxylate dehydrogenase
MINGVRGKSLSIEERREAAIELAALMLNEARRVQTSIEHRTLLQLSRMMEDPYGKAFTTVVTDECFRTKNYGRAADQLNYLIHKFGIPKFLSYFRKAQLIVFKMFGTTFPSIFIPLTKSMLRKETSKVIIPGEKRALIKHLEKRKQEGVRVNLNKLGEAILGEEEAEKKMKIYLADLANPKVEYISVKVSTLCSQLNLIGWEETLFLLKNRLKKLYRTAMSHEYVRQDGKRVEKFVNLDMEEYRDLHLTVELFKKVLDDPEFYQYSAGIVLQSYLPDSFLIQQELTVWAMQRVETGGAPIKIRIVKGANLAMEKVDASLRGYPQAPYLTKADVDANYKRMLHYACTPEHAHAARVGVGSHNLFDIAYVLLLRSELRTENAVEFEMLEGMADHLRRVVQELSGDMLLYCPAAKEKEFLNAIAYLVRRLDENTAPENFLRYIFDLIPGTIEWREQAALFSLSCHTANAASLKPRRTQNRFLELKNPNIDSSFSNEPDTDWSLPQNRKWIQNLLIEWKRKNFEDVPLIIGGVEIAPNTHSGIGRDPSCPHEVLYRHALADGSQIDTALKTAEKAHKRWGEIPVIERSRILAQLAHLLRTNRGMLIGAMVADGGKTVSEADVEVSEAVDFVEYYRRNMEELSQVEDIQWNSRGVVVVAPPWNFPCSIPMGGIAAALITGNTVIFKPALEVPYVGWKLANLCWEAGIPKDVLQFVLCEDVPVGSQLIKDPRVACVLLTGSTDTAKLMLKMRPGLNLIAETGGKNAFIISRMSDRDLAIKDLVHSAFGHAGQKCSACSLAICEKEVYQDPQFRETLRDAAKSLRVGTAWDLSTRINPLIREAGEALLRGLTTLEEGEEWLLEPRQDPENPNLWSPGIKLGVKKGSFTHQTELFGPVLGIMEAENLEEAVDLANSTRYGLTSGINTLDEREQKYWIEHIQAGNCYVNRVITGAVVQRQPFGGCKESSFGPGAKAGGPNFVMQLMIPEQKGLPKQLDLMDGTVKILGLHLEKIGISGEQRELWNASVGSYAYYWKNLYSKEHDPSLLYGQDNILKYVPREKIAFRINALDINLNVMRVIAAALTCGTELEVSGDASNVHSLGNGEWTKLTKHITIVNETEAEFVERIKSGDIKRVRFISNPSLIIKQAIGEAGANLIAASPVANGRVELMRYLREISLSIDYHRYGNLGLRENEVRAEIK